MEYLLGIDIGGTHVKGGIVTGTTGKMDQRTIVYEKIDAGGYFDYKGDTSGDYSIEERAF